MVYISIGTEAKWRDWSVKTIYEGLKKLGVKVVWSLQEGFEIPEPENPNFYVKAWMPQIEVLAHPAIKAGLTHCGMGGTMEFINACVPGVLWPHFGDQRSLAEFLEKRGGGKILAKKEERSKDYDKTVSFVNEVFTAQEVHDIF